MFTTTATSTLKTAAGILAAVFIIAVAVPVQAQAVSEVITDYNGYWKTSTSATNNVKPDNSHNLLSFGFNGTRYSTGVNDALLTSHGDAFTPGVFKALPLQNYNGVINTNTKIGLGALADGVANGTPAGNYPSRDLGKYLNDGPNGLDLGTCVANFPTGTLFLSISNLQAANIGDGVPDILVTQTADPSSKYDRYAFTDINGNVIGNSLDIVLTNIAPVGNWVADFFEATGSGNLSSGFTQTQRAVRLWAADLSAFGIDASNINSIAYFKIILSGDSDLAFVAYNTTTISLSSSLDVNRELETAATRQTRTVNRDAQIAMTAYPNPAKAFVNIGHPTATGKEKIVVYNMQGVMLKQAEVSKGSVITRMDIPLLPGGTYQVVLINNGVKTSRLVVVSA